MSALELANIAQADGGVVLEIVYEVLSGSHAYGLATHTADEDVRGIFVPSGDDILGFGYKGTIERKPDKAYHSIAKYLRLTLKANPSLLAWLWVRPEFVLRSDSVGEELRENRNRLLSKVVFKTFGGYATSQLRKMEKSVGSFEGYALHGERNAEADPRSLKAGYDTKNCLHLIRLLRCGVGLLEKGEYELYRERDREELLDIRDGNWPMRLVMAEVDRLFKRMETAKESSRLPDQPDREWAERFLRQVHYQAVVVPSGEPF